MKFAKRLHRGHIALVHDVIVAGLSCLLSLWLRLGSDLSGTWDARRLALISVVFAFVAGLVFLSLRMYQGIWRYASTRDLAILVKASTVANLVFLPLLFIINRLQDLPRSFLVINWFVLITLLGGPRFVYRIARDRRDEEAAAAEGVRAIPVLLIGAGDSAELFLRATQGAGAQYRAVGIVAETASRVGRGIHGVPVLGIIDELEDVVAALEAKGQAPERLIVTNEAMAGDAMRRLLDRADALGLSLARLPRMTDLTDAQGEGVQLRPIAVEDLLGRPQTVLDRGAMSGLVAGRTVLVTGAGGSIGSELVRQLAECEPAELILLDNGEFALYTIDREMDERFPALARQVILADVRDRQRIAGVMALHRPDLVFHAAALKHVPLVEENPLEGLLTNAVGTRIVADACRAHAVPLMVLISTDKAVNPSSIMGVAKRIAESYCQAFDRDHGTRFVTVRFGNVLGSTGSVVPLFERQLRAGGPITVTHPEMTRYFMTIREAVALILQGAAFVWSHPALYRGRIFMLDMGEPVRILDLARQMIRLAGRRPDHDIAITFTGLRPGEKLFEELFHGAEAPVPTEMDGILLAATRAGDPEGVAAALDRLEAACRDGDRAAVQAVIDQLVPEYAKPDSASPFSPDGGAYSAHQPRSIPSEGLAR